MPARSFTHLTPATATTPDRAREAVVEVVLSIPVYGKPEQDAETAHRALQAVDTAFHGKVKGKWRRKREKTLRAIVLRSHGF